MGTEAEAPQRLAETLQQLGWVPDDYMHRFKVRGGRDPR